MKRSNRVHQRIFLKVYHLLFLGIILLLLRECLVRYIFFSQQTRRFIFTGTTPKSNHVSSHISTWDMINSEWSVWPGKGFCRGNRSLISGVDDDVCFRRECVFSSSTDMYVDLNRMLTFQRDVHSMDYVRWAGSEAACRPATGGQARTPKGSPVEVSFIYSTFNSDKMASAAILEVFRTAHEAGSAEFVIIDDGSSEDMDTLKTLLRNLKHFFQINIIRKRHYSSQGYTLSNSEAIRNASGTYAMLLNTDVFVIPGWLKMLLQTMKTNVGGRVGMVGPMMLDDKGAIAEAGGGLYRFGQPYNSARGHQVLDQSLLHARVVDYISAACLLVRRQVFIDLNLFNVQFSPAYYEDTDAAVAFAEHGWQTVLQPFSVVIHHEGSSYGNDKQPFKEKQMKANGLRFYEAHKATLDNYCPAPHASVGYPALMAHMGNSFYRQHNRILVLEDVVPEPDRDAGSIRLTELLHLLAELGHSVTFEAQPFGGRNVKYTLQLLSEGINVVMPGTLIDMAAAVTSSSFNSFNPGGNFKVCPWDAIFICRRDVFTRHIQNVKRVCPHAPIIFDTVDVYFLRELRMLNVKQNPNSKHLVPKGAQDVVESLKNELLYMLASDITLVVSTSEKKLLNELLGPAADVRIVSNIYRPPGSNGTTATATPHIASSRSGAVFVGNMCHQPNLDAVDYITRHILHPNNSFPPDFRVHMVWSRSNVCIDPIHFAARQHPLVVVHRDISNDELYALHRQVKVVLAPLRYGAGVKGKVNYALLHGVPVVATSIAAEGMGLEDGKNYLQADTGKQFADAINRIYADDRLFQKLVDNGREVMSAKFGYNAAKKTIEATLIDLRAGAVTGQPHVCPNLAQFDNQTGAVYWHGKSLMAARSSKTQPFFPLFPRLSFTPDYIQYAL